MRPAEPTLDAGSEPIPPIFGHTVLPPRYEDLGRLGAGATSEVHQVRDRQLDRVLAMKILRAGAAHRNLRFQGEALVTARLQHPGIVPILDSGTLDDGRPWFTMPIVDGLTFEAALAAGHGRRRMLERLESAANAVAYAHAEGVVHRDLKPANLMIGRFGEVLVLDWGIAKAEGIAALANPGAVLGTLAYMAPEQAGGDPRAHDPRADVHALGAILYEVLAGHPPRPPGIRPEEIAAAAPRPLPADAPPDLAALVAAALSRDPADRPPDAGHVQRALRRWLDGESRRENALHALNALDPLPAEIAALREEAAARRSAARAALADVRPSAPIADKRAGWALEDDADALDRRIALVETRYVEGLHGVLLLDPELPAARDRLADHYLARWAQAEAANDAVGAEQAAFRVRQHDGGRHAARLTAEAEITLETDPPGACVHLERYVEVDRALRPVPVGVLGTTPLLGARIAPGSWRLRITHPGCHEVVLPVVARRGEPLAHRVHLPGAGSLGADERYVPPGWFDAGGDPEAIDAVPASRWWIQGFAMTATHVTNRDYGEFLDALPPDEASRYAGGFERAPGGWRPATPLDGNLPGPDLPAVFVDWHGATAYAAWRAARDGLPWRLPHDLEWEKAARGVDRRTFPWGDRFDATFARMQGTLEGPPAVAPVGAHPVDEGPYGHRDLAGNVRDWCANGYARAPVGPEPSDPGGPLRIVRGGAMTSGPAFCRAAGRTVASATSRMSVTGFRLARWLRSP